MKQLEKKMLQAIAERKSACFGNTSVVADKNKVAVYLFGNPIFVQKGKKKYYSDCGWKTVTTSSRLRALGADYSTNQNKCNCKLHTRTEMDKLIFSR